MNTRKPHIYMGVVILPADRNCSGIRWSARLDSGERLRTETLDDMKSMIREKLGLQHP